MTLGDSFMKYDSIGNMPTVQVVWLSCFLQTHLGQDLGILDGLVDQTALRMTFLRGVPEV